MREKNMYQEEDVKGEEQRKKCVDSILVTGHVGSDCGSQGHKEGQLGSEEYFYYKRVFCTIDKIIVGKG